MNTVPAIFLPASACLSHPAAGRMASGICVPLAAPWWSPSHITLANLGWYIAAFMIAGCALACLSQWIRDRWEITWATPGRLRACRRWYGTHAQVRLRPEADDEDAPRYVVLAWDGEDTGVPWLKVRKLDSRFLTYLDEDAEPFCAPVTCFAPYAVRRFRPGVTMIRRVPVPWLTAYPLLPYLVRVPQEARDAA